MYCPRCGQEQITEETRFCSRCGFLLTGIAEVMANDGALPVAAAASTGISVSSPRKKGLKQGLFIFLLTFLVVPLLSIFTLMLDAEPYAVVIGAIVLTVGGLLRMAYALMFEASEPGENTLEQNVYQSAQSLLNKKKEANALPPQTSFPVDSYAPPGQGTWRDTNDLTPSSVTDNTTKLLQKDE